MLLTITSFSSSTVPPATTSVLTSWCWPELDPIFYKYSQENIKEECSHSIHHENPEVPFFPIIFSSLQWATLICTFPRNHISDFVLYRYTEQTHSKLWNSLSVTWIFWELLLSVSVYVIFPFSALLVRVFSKPCSTDSIVRNGALRFCLHYSYCLRSGMILSELPTYRVP